MEKRNSVFNAVLECGQHLQRITHQGDFPFRDFVTVEDLQQRIEILREAQAFALASHAISAIGNELACPPIMDWNGELAAHDALGRIACAEVAAGLRFEANGPKGFTIRL